MRTIVNRVPVAVAIGLVAGLVAGFVVATAMGRRLHLYQRFIGVAVITAAVIVGTWVYRTYLKPQGAHVEETPAREVEGTS